MKKLLAIFALCMFQFVGVAWDENDHILMWQLGSTGNTVDGGPNDVYTFLGFDHANDEIGVRIAAYDKDGNLVKYLNPVYPNNPDYPGGIDWEYNDQVIGTRDDIWMTRASQAYYGPNDYAEYLFQMQVGNYDNDYNFMELLYSDAKNVPGKYWYDQGTILPPSIDWIPTEFFTVNHVVPVSPEPNSFILLSLGICLLGLRRRLPKSARF